MNSSTKQPPCKNCLCVPVCKIKPFQQFISDCSWIKSYLFNIEKSEFAKRMYILEGYLLPTKWHPTTLADESIRIVEFTEYDSPDNFCLINWDFPP